jgi:hypothetical protein
VALRSTRDIQSTSISAPGRKLLLAAAVAAVQAVRTLTIIEAVRAVAGPALRPG